MWTYRVVKEVVNGGTDTAAVRYGVCEVYDSGGYTDPVEVSVFPEKGDDPMADLRVQLEAMLKALDKPIYEPTS